MIQTSVHSVPTVLNKMTFNAISFKGVIELGIG